MTTAARYRVTAKELEALRLAAQGLPYPEIGRRMGLSTVSIARYMQVMARMTGCTGRTQLVVLYTRTPELFAVKES